MINTCCNLYFYYNFIVHGGIRHLEKRFRKSAKYSLVHGGIRHLENFDLYLFSLQTVHDGIRHLSVKINNK